MYDNIGGKIKKLTTTIAGIGTFIAVLVGLFLFSFGTTIAFVVGVLAIIAGSLVAWISSWFLYGYGELIEKTSEIAKSLEKRDVSLSGEDLHTQGMKKRLESSIRSSVQSYQCPWCQAEIEYGTEECPFCHQPIEWPS